MMTDPYDVDVLPVDAIDRTIRHLHRTYEQLSREASALEERASELRKFADVAKARIRQMEEAVYTLTAIQPTDASAPLPGGCVIPVL